MRLIVSSLVVLTAIILMLLSSQGQRADANGYYGYNNYRHNYGYGGYNYFNYYPTYSYGYPTIPTYGYNYYQPSYGYQQSYSSSPNYYDGQYHYHDAGYWKGQYYPAGNYAWRNGTWVSQAYGAPTAPPDWKNSLLEVAKMKEEYRQFSDALKSLGLQGSGFAQSHDNGYNYSNANANLGTYGANGSTVYGYTINTVKDLYGTSDINTLFQQSQRLAQNAQALGGQAASEFQAAVSQEGTNRSRVAEILARAQAAEQALRAAEGTGSRTTTSSTTFQIAPNGQGQGQTQQQQQLQPRVNITPEFAQLATAKCLKCHGPDKKEAKLDIRDYPAMSTVDKEKIWERIMADPKSDKLMPKGGPPLTPEEKRIFFTN